jgi:hypothetical protein
MLVATSNGPKCEDAGIIENARANDPKAVGDVRANRHHRAGNNSSCWVRSRRPPSRVPWSSGDAGLIHVTNGLGGLLAFDTLGRVMPAAVHVGVHLLEANLITPVALGRRVTFELRHHLCDVPALSSLENCFPDWESRGFTPSAADPTLA